jgi:hypothetical protein
VFRELPDDEAEAEMRKRYGIQTCMGQDPVNKVNCAMGTRLFVTEVFRAQRSNGKIEAYVDTVTNREKGKPGKAGRHAVRLDPGISRAVR